MSAGAVRLLGVDKAYDDGGRKHPVLAGFELAVPAGERVAVCGPSGSGKSTLLNLVAGIVRADAGSVRVCVRDDNGERDTDVHTLTQAAAARFRRRHIGYVFQFFNLVPTLTVEENVLLPLKLNGRMDLWPQSLDRLRTLKLGERLRAFPDTLSGGERQRVAIARALAHEPDVLLADEPTGNLDAANSALVADLLFGEAERLGKTLLIATHSGSIAERASQRIDLG